MPEDDRIVVESDMRRIGKQIQLPWSKAVEIAAKSMKIRFGRSLVTTASIVLAIAFLMSILTTTTLITSLKTRPVRRVVESRRRYEAARQGKDIGFVFPADRSLAEVKTEINRLQADLKKKTLSPLDRRMAQARLPLLQAERRVLEEKQAVRAAEQEIARLEKQLAALSKTEVDDATARERARLDGLLLTPELRRLRGQAISLEKRVQSRQLSRDEQTAARKELRAVYDRIAKRLPPIVQAQISRKKKELARLRKTEPVRLAKALARWRPLQAYADKVRVENEWQLLWRTLQSEGYTDVELEVTRAPEEVGFFRMLVERMEPRDLWLAILAVLVCLVGITNAMLMSVHERFREIGTMKCLGALESFIVKLYFLESSFIGVVGTLMGILVGFALSMVRAMSAFGVGRVLQNFDWSGAFLSALCTLFIGSLLSIIAAILPARSAAKMDPVLAMRVDE